MRIFSFTVQPNEVKQTAKLAIKQRFMMSTKYMRKVRRLGQLRINGEPARLWYELSLGDEVELSMPKESKVDSLHFPEDQPPVYLSDDVFVISKKVGQVVHPCLNSELEDLCNLVSSEPLHPVQRLDRDTSGLVLFALHPYAHHLLSLSSIERKYNALVHGRPPKAEGVIELPIARSESSLIERCVNPQGKDAKTGYKVLQTNTEGSISLIEFELFTGRTHQIRVHASHLGFPLIGDSMYGRHTNLDLEMGRQALHASDLVFIEPITKKRVVLHDPPPQDFDDFLKKHFP